MQSSNEHDGPGTRTSRSSSVVTALSPLAGYGAALPVGFLAHASSLVLVAVGVLAVVRTVTAEWQRRRTLVAVLRNAPRGSVVEQDGGVGGPSIRVRIGSSPPRRRRGSENARGRR